MANQFIGIATECLPLTGGTLSGQLRLGNNLVFAGSGEMIWNTEAFTTNWARGITIKTGGNIVASMGVYGSTTGINNLYMGVGASPWGGANALTVTSSDVAFNGVSLARINGSYSGMTVGKAANATNATNAEHATYATSSGSATNATNATTATSATCLSVNNTESVSVGRLQYLQMSSNATIMPSTSWWSLIRAQHTGYANGYWQELALGFANAADNKGIKYRTNISGTKSAWYDVALMNQENGYWGFYFPTNNTYLRTPPTGLLPNSSSSAGVGYLGTSGWPFLAAYAKTFYGNLSGNATTATSATSATNSTNAANLTYFKNTSNVNVGVDDVTANAVGYVNGISILGKTDGGLFKQVYSSAWAGEIFIDYRTGMLASRGKNNGTWTLWNNVVSNTQNSIPRPIGGSFISNVATTTGALKVRFPVGFTSTMLKLTIDIFNYATGESCTYYCSGYNYSTPSWVNVTAYSTGKFNSNRSNLTVSFCNDGGTPAIVIGAVGTTWPYVQVEVRDVFLGYSGYSNYAWQQGWSVSFVTTMPTVMTSVANPANWYQSYNAVTAGSATNSTQLGGIAAANYINTGDTLILRGTA